MKIKNTKNDFIIEFGKKNNPKSLYYFRVLKQNKYIEFKFHPLYIVVIKRDKKVLPTLESNCVDGKYFKGFGLKIAVNKVYIKETT